MALWQFFSLMLVGWFISYQLALLDPNKRRSTSMAKLFRFLIGVCWLLALIYAIYPKIAHASGPYTDWQDGSGPSIEWQDAPYPTWQNSNIYNVPMLHKIPSGDTVAYVYTLDTVDTVNIPRRMAANTGRVWSECEVKGRWFALYGFPEEAVGLAGELGQAQIHPIHFPRMESIELDPYLERDRILFAVILWEERGWKHWSCGNGVE